MSKEQDLTRIQSVGHAAEAKEAGAPKRTGIEPLFTPDRAHRAVPPSQPLPKRYARNVIAEVFADRYAEQDARRMAEEDAAEARRKEARTVLARKAGARDEGDDTGGGGLAPIQDTPPAKPKKDTPDLGF